MYYFVNKQGYKLKGVLFMNMPINELLYKKINSKVYPFHMPGHKRNSNFLFYDIINYDFTELEDTDNLYNANGIIKESLKQISNYFNADESHFLVNGSSGGIIASILSCVDENKKVIVARNCHKSIYNALILSGAIPVYIMPELTEKGLQGGISSYHLESIIKENKDISAVIITSPTYEGFCSDIEEISKIVHRYNKILIVDEAHGAHFAFSNYFPESSVSNADIVIQSWHKTLPVLTQCSVIHINGNRINKDKLNKVLSIVQTSSPSYIFMAYMEKVFSMLKHDKSYFEEYVYNLKKLRSSLEKLNTIELLGSELIGKYNIKDIDFGKLVFYINSNINAHEIENILFKKYNIQIEMSSLHYIILITSIADTNESFDKLYYAIKTIDKKLPYNKIEYNNIDNIYPNVIISPRKAFYADIETLEIKKSIGRISAETITPYPPGIPIIAMGELISNKIVETILKYKENSVTLTGMQDKTLKKINVLKNF